MIEPAASFEHAGVWVEIVPDIDPAASPQENDNAGTIYSWTRDFDGDESISEPNMTITCPVCQGTGEGKLYEVVDNRAYGRVRETGAFGSLCEAESYIELNEPADARWVAELQDCPKCEGSGEVETDDLSVWFALHFDAALTIPLQFQDWRSNGARLLTTDDCDSANCALCFTQKEIDHEWSGHLDPYPVKMRNADGSLTGEVQEYGGARRYAEARIGELDDYFQGNVYGVVIRDAEDGEVLESVWGFIGDLFGESGKYIRDEARDMAETEAERIAEENAEAHRWACADVVTV